MARVHVDPLYSFAFCEGESPLSTETMSDLLELAASKYPERRALIFPHENKSKTLGQFNCDVTRLANALRTKCNLEVGDKVSIWSANCYTYLVVQYACARAGLFLWLHNYNYKSNELQYELEMSSSKVLFLPGPDSEQQQINDFVGVLNSTAMTGHPRKLVFLDGSDSRDNLNSDQVYNLPGVTIDELVEDCSSHDKAFNGSSRPHDAFISIFSSGTTGKPKAIVLSQFAILNNHLISGKRFNINCEQTLCLPVSLIHSAATVSFVPGIFTFGYAIVFPGYKYSLTRLVEALEKYECPAIMAPPTMLNDLCYYIEKSNVTFPHLKSLITGSTSMPIETSRRLVKLIPSLKNFQLCYGATEAGALITCPKTSLDIDNCFDNVGFPLEYVRVKLVDLETKTRLVKLGKQGLALVKTPFKMVHYHNEEEKTNEVLDSDGWLNTGDVLTMCPSGQLSFVCRVKHLISRGGVKVSPVEVEEVIHQKAEVRSVSVFGVPDKRLGEELCAWITMKNNQSWTPDGVRRFVAERLANYKVPRYVIFSDNVPLTTSGKVAKNVLALKAAEMLALKQLVAH